MKDKYNTARAKSKKYFKQLSLTFKVRNQAWGRGYMWGFETFRVLAQSPNLRTKVYSLSVEDFEVDPAALDELALIWKEELPEVEHLLTVVDNAEHSPS
jgi:hypothetical protein